MKVIDLYHELGEMMLKNPEVGTMRVILSSDEEGNSYREANLSGISYYLNDEYESYAVHPDDVGTEYDVDEFERVIIVW